MTILITLTTVGIDCSTFDIYSNVDGFLSAFETDIPKNSLLTGFSSANVPDGTTVIRVKAKGVCTNYIDIITTISGYEYSISDIGYYDLATACGALANDIVYSRDAPYLYIGDRVYKDSTCTSPLDGGDLWYSVSSPYETDVTVIQISSSGVILDRGYCSRGGTTTTTSTTSTSPILPPNTSITCHQWQISTITDGGATFTNCLGEIERIYIGGANGIDVTNFCSLSSDPSEITLLPNTSLNYIGVCME